MQGNGLLIQEPTYKAETQDNTTKMRPGKELNNTGSIIIYVYFI